MKRPACPGPAAAEYRLKWVACVELEPHGPFYTVTDDALKAIPDRGAGIYLFCRRHGETFVPRYVGRSKRLRQRIREHLERVSLVRALADGEGGRRVVLVAIVEPRRGQCASRVAQDVESLLLRHLRTRFLLVNERGMRTPTRKVRWRGGRAYASLIPREMTL